MTFWVHNKAKCSFGGNEPLLELNSSSSFSWFCASLNSSFQKQVEHPTQNQAKAESFCVSRADIVWLPRGRGSWDVGFTQRGRDDAAAAAGHVNRKTFSSGCVWSIARWLGTAGRVKLPPPTSTGWTFPGRIRWRWLLWRPGAREASLRWTLVQSESWS